MPDRRSLVQPLFSGPLDIVGDIHGEIEALRDLLRALGYRPDGQHPRGRRLVFVGDLGDRGTDSPAVMEFVRGLVAGEFAQCIVGNHELNVLRMEPKEGNGWFFERNHDQAKGKFRDSQPLPREARPPLLEFLHGLPLALERPDLRVIHACWHEPAIALLRNTNLGTVDLYAQQARLADAEVEGSGVGTRAKQEEMEYHRAIHDQEAQVPLLENLGRREELQQMGNLVRVVTSGPERLAARPFFASGKWRMVDRLKWWDEYVDPVPVVIGHYWRWPDAIAREQFSRGERDMFPGLAPNQWHGASANVFCVDYGVGARYKERAEGRTAGFRTRLGALRWPERELVFDA